MWNKTIVISRHVKERFQQRNIRFVTDKYYISIESQIRKDLKALNIIKQEKINDREYKITTKQGKVYIIKHLSYKKVLIKTVYAINLRDKALAYLDNRISLYS